MKLSINWLRELAPAIETDVEKLCARLTLLGLEVEEVTEFELSFPGVKIGHVIEAAPHPDADRLRVCRVDVGGEELGIVCGAPNVRAGLKVAVATVGAVLPGDFKIKKSKIRGQVSLGMICSEKELGLGQGHDGIMELDDDVEVGGHLDALFGARDTVVEIEVTPNRPDWLSHIGVARELVAHYGGKLVLPEVETGIEVVTEDTGYAIDIEDPVGCRRFRARLIDDVKVGPSPLWMRQRLLALGQRPINAIVDASNYVLHEIGHPNHCFDRDALRGKTVHVRRAKAGESFTTLDDTERELAAHHLLVADDGGGLALAGIMGGADSEVSEGTRNLLLEVAVFDPRTVRQGRRDHVLSTDASYRFERGVDFDAVPWVSQRLCDLILQVAGGTAHDVAVEAIGQRPEAPESLFVRASHTARVLGVALEPERMKELLDGLDIRAEVKEQDGETGIVVTAPSFRHDLLAEIDVIEELGRHYGFDSLPEQQRVPMAAPAERTHDELFRRDLRAAFAARGFNEVFGSSFMRADDPDALALADDDPRRRAMRVLNPVVQGEETLKTTAIGEMARVVERNRRRGWTDPVRIFQIARVFRAQPDEVLAEEAETLMVGWSGPVRPLHASDPARDVDLFDALGDVFSLTGLLDLELTRRPGNGERWMRSGSQIDLVIEDERVGVIGEIAPSVARALDVEAVVLVAEFDLAALDHQRKVAQRYRSISSYPPARRDLSLVVPRDVTWAQVESTTRDQLAELVESCELFDVYEGDDLPPNSLAMGVRLALRSHAGTLKDKKVDGMIAALLERLRAEHAIVLRTG